MRVTAKAVSVVLVLIAAAAMCSCGGADNRTLTPVVDLLDTLDQAERRPFGAPFDVAPVTLRGETHRALATPGASRVTWDLHLPDRAVFQVLVALKEDAWTTEGDGVYFRISIAEGRTQEDLLARVVNPYGQSDDRRWIPLTVDLGAHSGFKWSLFYHPRRLLWRIGLHTNAGVPGSVDTRGDMPLWAEPRILR